MLKFAVADVSILESVLIPQDANRSSRRLIAHRHHFDYTPQAGFLYVRSRAISSRCNDNYDEFPAEEIAKSFRSFIGKPVFVNHHNDDHRQMRGVVIDAALHRDALSGGAPDVWCEVLMEVDAINFPKLAEAILKGDIDRTSMGCDVAHSLCSVCGNKATNPAEYCQHIPRMKGQRIYRTEASTGKKVGILVREICYGLKFFENSLLVEEPADPTAYFTGVDDRGLQTTARKTAMRDQETCPHNQGFNLHGQCKACGYAEPTESDEPCDEPWCQANEPEHTKGEHIDPPHMDPHSDEYRDAQHAVENAFKGTEAGDAGWLLDQQRTGPTKYSVRQMAQHFAANVPFDKRQQNEIVTQAKGHLREIAQHARTLGHDPIAVSTRDGGIEVTCQHCFDSTTIHHQPQGNMRPDGFKFGGQMNYKPCSFNPQSIGYSDQQAPPGDPVPSQGWSPDKWLKPSLNALAAHFGGAEPEKPGDGSYSIPLSDDDRHFYQQMRDAGEMRAQMHERGQKREVDLSDPTDLKAHMAEAHDLYPEDYWRNSHDEGHPALDDGSDDDRPLRPHELRALHDYDHKHSPGDYPGVIVGDSHFHSASKTARGDKPVSQMSEQEYAAHQAKTAKDKADGEKWNRRNPVKIKHIVEHWHAATADEKHDGMNWYEDAHHMSKHIGHDTGTDMATMAGLISNYSPQQHWATNIHTAARVARTKKALGGPGEGVMASKHQKAAAQRMLNGEHYDKVLAGPKTRSFAHLIEHGGNGPDSEGHEHVVVDRHALSVACGARASDAAYSHSKLGTKGRYDHVSNAYRKAAEQISKEVGYKVHPHQVQGVTWLARQRLNEEQDRELSKTSKSSSAALARLAVEKWNDYAGEHHPGLLGKIPGSGYSSAPDDVKHSADLADEGKVSKQASGGSNDRMVTCDQGHQHWGAEGAAGLLLRHRGHDGQTRYLLQKRGPQVDNPNTHSIPGGALGKGETPEVGAVREAEEEMGVLPNFRSVDTHVSDCGGWKYHTLIGDVDHKFDPPGDNNEHGGAGWYTPQEISGLKLHPGFESSWADISKEN